MVSPAIPNVGEFKISFLIKKATSKYTCVGVSCHSVSVNSLLGHGMSWAYSSKGQISHLRKSEKQVKEAYGEGYGEGDVIQVIINKKEGELKFIKNEKDLGVAFKDINLKT